MTKISTKKKNRIFSEYIKKKKHESVSRGEVKKQHKTNNVLVMLSFICSLSECNVIIGLVIY